MHKLKYPVYIPSRGRWKDCSTARLLSSRDVDFKIVVEPNEEKNYASIYGRDRLLVLPLSNQGIGYSRTWIKRYSTNIGEKKHWQIDDDMLGFSVFNRKNVASDAEIVLSSVEDFCDRYNNIGAASLSNRAYAFAKRKPYTLNTIVYGVTLVNNDNDIFWRLQIGEDTDFSLQMLFSGLCTVSFNALTFTTRPTGSSGGCSDFYENDGYLNRARSLEKMWPRAFDTTRIGGRVVFKPKKSVMNGFTQTLTRSKSNDE